MSAAERRGTVRWKNGRGAAAVQCRIRPGHEARVLDVSPEGVLLQTQRRLLTVLAIGIAMILTLPVNRYIAEQVPERRGIKDDLTEAALQGVVRAAAFFVASLVVRQIAGSR